MDSLLSIWKNRTPHKKVITQIINRDKIIRSAITLPYHIRIKGSKPRVFQSSIVPALNLVKAGFPLRSNNLQPVEVTFLLKTLNKDLIYYFIHYNVSLLNAISIIDLVV